MLITELLRKDHEDVRDLFARLSEPDVNEDTGTQLAAECVRMLRVHTVVEERIFYPDLQAAPGRVGSHVRHSYAEHGQVNHLLDRLEGLGPRDKRWKKTIQELRRAVERHVAEEEGDLFPAAMQLLGRERLEEAGAEAMTMREGFEQGEEEIPLEEMRAVERAETREEEQEAPPTNPS